MQLREDITVARDMDSMQEALAEMARAGKRIALVPTMGALHAGHQSLFERARQQADEVVVSIFVNPKQFGINEDFDKYPRSLDADIKKAREAGATLIYAPSLEDLYSEDFSTTVSVGKLGTLLCGRFRPGHFDGVATVVAKLLLRTLPHVAIFGEKDYQQLCVINRMVEDLDIAVEIVGAPTLREADGLAMSSRNAYLSAAERAVAPKLYAVMNEVAKAMQGDAASTQSSLAWGLGELVRAGFKVDYLELCEPESLRTMEVFHRPARLLVAAWLGTTRLIDNIAVE